jgi:hypothetical protein
MSIRTPRFLPTIPFSHPLSHVSDRFNSAGPVKIVAIGSSSTVGERELLRILADWNWH